MTQPVDPYEIEADRYEGHEDDDAIEPCHGCGTFDGQCPYCAPDAGAP